MYINYIDIVTNIFYPIKTNFLILCNYLKVFMNIYTNLDNKINESKNSFNIILADKDIETFKSIQRLNDKFNFINLSSCFAVNFILEYEKIDLIVISKKISNLTSIIERANKKKINVYIIGKDIKSPVDEKEIEGIVLSEIRKKTVSKKDKQLKIKRFINNLLDLNRSKKLILKANYRERRKMVNSLTELGREINTEYKKESLNNGADKNKKLGKSNGSSNKDNIKDLKLNKEDPSIKFQNEGYLKKQNNIEIEKIKTIKQKIIIILKAKGGVGSTIISIFLGFVFNKIKTLLVDLNFSEGGGDISYYLGIPRSPNILNFIDGYNRNSLENSVIKIRENLDVLQTPPTYEMSKKVDLQDIYCLADIAKKKYHLIIFDLPNKFDDLSLGIIDLADLLIMVSDNTLGSIGRLIKMNNVFIYDDLEKILVINKYSKLSELNLFKNQIEQFFHLKDFVFLDEDEILRSKSEFSNFDFSNLESFKCLTEKIFNLLIYD